MQAAAIHKEIETRTALIGPTILLRSGRYFSFEHPERTPIRIEDIAHGLSNLCRFTGQCKRFYSVAQHAVLVSHIVPKSLAFQALHHDDAEAVMGDMSSPLKKMVPQYKELETRIEASIWRSFGLPEQLAPQVKMADLIALRTEQRDLMHIEGGEWAQLGGIDPWPEKIVPLPPDQACAQYLQRHWELLP